MQVISRIDLRGLGMGALARTRYAQVLPRAALDIGSAVELVTPVLNDVRDRGLAAVIDVTKRFDGVELDSTRVPQSALDAALAAMDPSVKEAVVEAARRARLVHQAQARTSESIQLGVGAQVVEKWVPVSRVGLYVPGGLVAYPSSVVMNVIPAQVAGVQSLAVASPPQAQADDPAFIGLPHPSVLAACALLGITEVYAVGGAQAVGMFAYGTQECEPVDLVTGPGNVYVAAAKRVVRGTIGIDSEAGPTEIGILADASADPAFVAADLIAQAEHDENASCLLVTDSPELMDAVDREVALQLKTTVHRDRVVAALTNQSAYALVDDLDQGLEVVDAWAAEHLEVITVDAVERAERVRNAGAIFVGPWAPVSLGDYLAGSNHVLPTGGSARHTGGLSVQSFLRSMHVVTYSKEALAQVAPLIDALGGAEDLHSHVAAVRVRIPGSKP